MSEPFVFDSRCESCKTPYGAAPCGSAVTLRVRPLTREGFTHCALVLCRAFAGATEELPLSPEGYDGERRRFGLTFPAPAEPELCWYHFRLWRDDGSGCLLDRSGYRSEGEAQPWQLTVYDDTRPTPAWFGEGMTYHIFPDRFCRLGVPDPAGLPGDRWVHENWDDAPAWGPEPDGVVRCRDFFGGSLPGIRSKLDYLAELGVSTIYLCPIFTSASNHRYNTADYLTIDPMLGTEEDFRQLCRDAEERGIRIVLDGVFNHTGSDSVYFNALGTFSGPGAAQSQDSPYYPWFRFRRWPDSYESWWGIDTLPAVEEQNPDYQDFIFRGKDSVVRRWLRAGASGWRLDVADELPDSFIAGLRDAVEETKPDALLLGEVWEDGSTKVAYGVRRRYLLGHETHGLMNYPFRTAALAWLTGGDAADFREAMETLREHYPRPAFYSAMNFLGTHDTPRILTLLGKPAPIADKGQRAAFRLNPEAWNTALERLQVAGALLYAFPGSPTLFYGDEAGMEGFEDPMNRGTYPWGRENPLLLAWFHRLGQLRRARASLRRGELEWLYAAGPGLAFRRRAEGEVTLAALNAGDETLELSLPWEGAEARDAITGRRYAVRDGWLHLPLGPRSALLLTEI